MVAAQPRLVTMNDVCSTLGRNAAVVQFWPAQNRSVSGGTSTIVMKDGAISSPTSNNMGEWHPP